MAIFDRFAVVVVPFPFAERERAKRRPALVLSSRESFGAVIGHSVMAMITSARHAPWPLDVAVRDGEAAGLRAASVVRMKLFTLDHRLVLRVIGRLGDTDRDRVAEALERLLGRG